MSNNFDKKDFWIKITVESQKLDELIRSSIIVDGVGYSINQETKEVAAYTYREAPFLKRIPSSKNEWLYLFSLTLLENKILSRSFYNKLNIDYKIKIASRELTYDLSSNKRIFLEEIIYAPDECVINTFDKKKGEISFLDYVEGMNITNKKIKYPIGSFVLFKEEFYKNNNNEIEYRQSNISSDTKFIQATKMNIKDIRFIGRIASMTCKEERKSISIKYEVNLFNLTNAIELEQISHGNKPTSK